MCRHYLGVLRWMILGIILTTTMVSVTWAVPVLGIDCVTPSSSKTAKPPCEVKGGDLKFVIIGDWGGKAHSKGDEEVNANAAKTTIALAKKHDLHFVLNVGDNIYPYFSLTKSVDDQFDDGFHADFPEGEINLPFYSILGNHDYINRNGIKEQIDYTNHKKSGKRWILPELSYTINFKLSDNGKLAKFIMLDTQVLCGATIKDAKAQYRPTGREQMTPSELAESIALEKWIFKEIWKGQNMHYLFVVGHYQTHTIRSSVKESECLSRVLSDKQLARHGVTAYISGHEHLLQHWEVSTSDGTIHHVLSGEGYSIQKIPTQDVDAFKAKDSSNFFHGRLDTSNAPAKLFKGPRDNKPGVVVVKLGDSKASFEYIDDAQAEKSLHSFTVDARKPLEKAQGDAPVPGAPFNIFTRKFVVEGSKCDNEWQDLIKGGQKSTIVAYAEAGNLGCVLQNADAATDATPKLPAGGNRVALKSAGKSGKKPLPIWTCWRCVGTGTTEELQQAFCHVGGDVNSKTGFISYDRFANHDGFRYMCAGVPATTDNVETRGVLLVTTEFKKKADQVILGVDKNSEAAKPKSGYTYGLSEEIGFKAG